MRKYLHKAPYGNMGAPVSQRLPHWELYATLLRGSASVLGFDAFCSLFSSTLRRDVGELLSRVKVLDADPQLYDQPLPYLKALKQVVCFLKKFPFSKQEFPHDRRQTAFEKWLSAEDQCRKTNARLRETARADLPKFVHRARQLIADVLGELKPSLIMQMLESGTHGPGSTRSNHGGRVTSYFKFADLPYTVSEGASTYAYAAISSSPLWMEILERSSRRVEIPPAGAPQYQKELMLFKDCIEIVNNDIVDFVPKDALTDRPIGIGANLNMFLQLGVKDYIQDRLTQVGIDLSDQSENQRKAYLGSRYATVNGVPNLGQFSTIDLASASDTISKELVFLLLPTEWSAFLDDLRHKCSEIDGKEYLLEKFCAMGNGFTFPLESLIFWAVTKATILEAGGQCKRQDISVYGDDIIVRFEHATRVIESLEWCGFSVNADKSFLSGAFKESCGADFYRGTDVRPFYLKREIKTYGDCYFIANSIANRLMSTGPNRALHDVYHAALQLIPPSKRNYVPFTANIESGLYVPLSYLRQHGRQPWLSESERALLSKDNPWITDLQTGVYWAQGFTPKQLKGKAYVRMCLALFHSPSEVEDRIRRNRFVKAEDAEHMRMASRGQVSQRDLLRYYVKLAPTSNWYGSWTERHLRAHPLRG